MESQTTDPTADPTPDSTAHPTAHPTLADAPECVGDCAPDVLLVARFRRALRAVAGKWKVDILAALLDGPRRFGELRRAVPGVTRHMLTEQLRELTADGLVHRTAHAERVFRVDYELTDAGYGLLPVFRALRDWSAEHGDAIGPADPGSATLL